MKSDKRQSKRVNASLPLKVEGISASWEGMIKNLSVHGMCYSLPADLSSLPPEEKEVFLRFSLPDKMKSIEVMGWIAHNETNRNTTETGVTFMFLNPQDREMIQKFIK